VDFSFLLILSATHYQNPIKNVLKMLFRLILTEVIFILNIISE